jgi:hypothetical protein
MINQNEYVINLIGIGIRFWVYSPTHEEYLSILDFQNTTKKSLNELFFDFDFLAIYNRTHWSEFSEIENTGLLLQSSNFIEIRKKGRLIEKFNALDLIQYHSIFPLYNTDEVSLKTNESARFIIVQQEKGLIGKYKIQLEKLDLNQLIFQLQSINNNSVPIHLSQILLNEKELIRWMDDSVITNLSVYEMN